MYKIDVCTCIDDYISMPDFFYCCLISYNAVPSQNKLKTAKFLLEIYENFEIVLPAKSSI